jgi:two-component system chemotaxis response regulator CheB
MAPKRKIRVLVVDDSLMFRKAITIGLSKDASIEVVGDAIDPFMARDKILLLDPDVMTLDIEMPKMNGIDFLKKLMPQYPLPVVVVSSVSGRVFDAINAGAVDFVAKPDATQGLETLINELIVKIKIASIAKVGHWKKGVPSEETEGTVAGSFKNSIIAIGASTGGTEAIFSVVSQFPRNTPGTIITQHMPPGFTKIYADRLNNTCAMEVKEAQSGDMLYPGLVLIAPGDQHMRLRKAGSDYNVECFKGEKVSGHCPSVDVMFESVAKRAGADAIGVILTGMGADGAKGLLSMRKAGAPTVGQNEESCVVYGMPKVAYDLGAVQKQATLLDIPKVIFSMLGKK